MENDPEFRTDDELLSAWLDGELPDDLEAALEKRLASEPALALRLERLSEADAVLREAYTPVTAEPLPQATLDLLHARADRHRDETPATPQSATVVDLKTRRRAREPGRFSWPAALAASVTLAIGVVLGLLVAPRGSVPESGLLASTGSVERGSSLHETLENLPSGSSREIAPGVSVTPELSFASRDGGYCRELSIAGADGSAAALACRRDGGWQVEALSFLAGPAGNGGVAGGEFRPAGRASGAIDAAIDERIAGDPLDAAAESAVIARGWSPP